MGGSHTDPFCSCAEENLLAYRGDPYSTENIFIHEFAHNIHLRGMANVDPGFDRRVKAAYDAAMKAGLWKGKYAAVNHHEYFAEGVQSWFDDNRENDHDHNHVNTRAELLEYDPGLAALCREIFGDTVLTYTKPTTRLTGHMAGYDPAKAPEFVWPERLVEVRNEIRAAAQARDRAANAPENKKSSTTDKTPDKAKKKEAARGVRFDPVARDIEGWKVHVEPALLDGEHREEGAKALTMLANHLQRIKIVVPAGPLAKMQKLEIWIEHSHPTLKSKQYHPSRQWLVANGHDPRLTKKVHIPQARDLLSREQMLKHPAVILHELAHAYHDQVLSFDHPEIKAAYEQAKASGNYDSVLAHTGKKVKHYGLTTPQEYFAEATEAYFYRNDFYPFVRAELKEHDPELHAVLVKIWEGPKEDEKRDK
jgi:dipeptidyl-peptidase-4